MKHSDGTFRRTAKDNDPSVVSQDDNQMNDNEPMDN